MDHAYDTSPEGSPADNPWGLRRARVLSLISQKGGVGKTTSAVNLAAAFALCGHRALLVGADPQCGVSRSLGYGPDQLRGGLNDVLMGGLSLEDVAHATPLDALSMVVPDAWSLDEETRYKRLMAENRAGFLHALGEARACYDTVIIDCPPGFGPETQAALAGSDGYLVPVQAEELCRDTLPRLLEFVEEFGFASQAPSPRLEGLFLTMTDNRTRMSRHVADSLDREYESDLFDRAVPRNTRLADMALLGRPAVIYDRRSAGSRAYFDLVDEIMLRWHRRPAVEDADAAEGETLRAAAAVAGSLETVQGPFSPGPDPAPASPPAPDDADDDIGGSLTRLLRDLGGGTAPAPTPDWAGEDGNDEPELISLDDLIEEEEGSCGEAGDADGWGFGEDDYGTVN